MESISNQFRADQFNLYIDLDGVLVDFDSGFGAISVEGLTKMEYVKKHGFDAFWSLINSYGPQWWENLPWTPDGERLWRNIKHFNVSVLSSCSSRNTRGLARIGKQAWCNRHLGELKTILVDSSKDKKHYSSPESILIDDFYPNILEWNEQGGISIFHKSATTTLDELYKYL